MMCYIVIYLGAPISGLGETADNERQQSHKPGNWHDCYVYDHEGVQSPGLPFSKF